MIVAERKQTNAADKINPTLEDLVTVIRVNGGLFLKPKKMSKSLRMISRR